MKYLVELNSEDISADYILSELELEFERSPEKTSDPDILKLQVDPGMVSVLCDYDNNRVWLTIEATDKVAYQAISQRIETLLNRSQDKGYVSWSQIEIGK